MGSPEDKLKSLGDKVSNLGLAQINQVRARRIIYFLGFMASRGRNILFILIGNIIVGGLLFSLFDGKSIAEGQYLAFITASTIGYGDLSPETWGARTVAVAVGFNGLVLTGIIVALTVKALELAFSEEIDEISKASAGED